MEESKNVLDFLSNPFVVEVLALILIAVIAKLDKSNKVYGFIAKLWRAVESKKKQ